MHINHSSPEWLLLGGAATSVITPKTPSMAVASKCCDLCPLVLKLNIHNILQFKACFGTHDIEYISSKSFPFFPKLQVLSVRFWMMLHGASTPKPSLFMGNMDTLPGLDMGRLTKQEKAKRHTVKSTRNES